MNIYCIHQITCTHLHSSLISKNPKLEWDQTALTVQQIICDTVMSYINKNKPMTSIHNMDEFYNIKTQPQNQCILASGNKWRPNENRQRLIIQSLLIARESATITWVLVETKAGRGVEKIDSGKRKDFRCALIGGHWHREAASRLTRKISSVIG